MRARLARALVALSLLGACGTTEPTQVVLVIGGQWEGEVPIDTVDVEVLGPDGTPRAATAELTNRPLPRTLGLVHTQGPLGPFLARIQGLSGGVPIVERRARFSFVEGEVRVLQLILSSACIDSSCEEGLTCDRGSCRVVDIAPSELTPYPQGGLDAGAGMTPADGGLDGGMLDGGVLDGGAPIPDAATPTPDAGTDAATPTPDAGSCPAGCDCDLDCTSGLCSCNDGCCAPDCAGAETCDLRCQSGSCDVDATSAGTVRVDCRGGSTCETDCTGATDCSVQCRGSADCLVDCTGAASCGFSSCNGGEMSCPGDVFVCGRACP
ncbi:MAG TPA: hypothetical protein RMH85_03540 [Polyangiaceae bacterium LLY-WYZ-15_(1-7)]|nr:hypothetical protein [Polyangiaceae bacterium LLY-WYZ-15_(1-7)]HJL07539.1 hypothetical protein [Polyangiaceae bacterium LLY-WYZ-15_(1-7)]HJL34617.1 hypothetical protein [Polyangiaceae bacterium LLY-WYZ-15_(1-7)]HJL47170.1 hypothetical protein [Polyangiaceae bacterium LLY-WYZ-15_(1-7)]